MTTARVLSPLPQPRVGFDDGLRVLLEDCEIDLGQLVVFPPDTPGVEYRSEGAYESEEIVSTIVTVPRGFRYDGASIPGPLEVVMGRRELRECAGLVHDYLFRVHAGRATADRVFWIVSRSGEQRLDPVRGWMAWAALRCFGGLAYRRYGR